MTEIGKVIAFACNAKRFATVILFFLVFIPSAVFGRTGKSFLSQIRQLFLQTCVTKIGSLSFHILANYCVYVLKFRECEHGMPCALEINSKSGTKRGHVESFPSINHNKQHISTTTIPIATKLGRVVTCFDGLLPKMSDGHFIMWFCDIT